jgi:hypothetical protein
MTDPQRIDWGLLVSCILTHDDGRDRLRAQWNACNEVLENLQAYGPIGFAPLPFALTKIDCASEILTNSARADVEHNFDAKNVVKAFASWRAHVTEVEALNASRLFMLASTLRTLADLHGKASQPELVLARIADLGKFIESAWGVAIPLSTGDIRSWSQRVTRRYDLLSVEWREL